LDRIWAARCRFRGDVRHGVAGREALRRIGLVLERVGLTLHPAKTRLVDLRHGKESFVLLGCTIRQCSIQRMPWRHFMQRWPSPKATKKLRDRARELTGKRQSGKDVKQVIAELNPVLRGWGNCFRTGNADRELNMDALVVRSLAAISAGRTTSPATAPRLESALWDGLASFDGHDGNTRRKPHQKFIVKPCT
jgi:hypothetical protein